MVEHLFGDIFIVIRLDPDGKKFDKVACRKTLTDKFKYVMHGKLYKISEDRPSGQNAKVGIYASFGSLLMMLKGDPYNAASLELDQRVFLLIRKV
ncbi:hypothetical protein ACP4OV_013935 [Aristida adscensionis]